MGADSKIEWTRHTFSPWWGCTKVSQACRACYAEAWAKRTGHAVWGEATPRRFFGEKHWREPLKWNADAMRAGTTARVFCASMADVFENRRDLDPWRERLWELIEETPHLNWLLLTKRPEHVLAMVPRPWRTLLPAWLGVTYDDKGPERLDALAQIPARIRFVSLEPLLAPVNLRPWLERGVLDWVIAGAESGPRARPMNEDWVRALRDQCFPANVPFFYKQRLVGGRKISLPELDGRQWAEFPE